MLAQDFIPGLTPPPTHPAVPEFLRRWTTYDPPLNTYQCLIDTRIKPSKMLDITCRICYPEFWLCGLLARPDEGSVDYQLAPCCLPAAACSKRSRGDIG